MKLFAREHPDATPSLNSWYKVANGARSRSLDDVRETFPHADLVGDCTVFNIGGNKYRLITIIIYSVQRVYVRFVMTLTEYSKNRWKHDCC